MPLRGEAAKTDSSPRSAPVVYSQTPPPDFRSGPPEEIWQDYFSRHRPRPSVLQRSVLSLHNRKQHEHVIHALQAALTNGQSQPWMYEVLALSMEIAGRPRNEIERVIVSITDFGEVDFPTMMYSAAYLARFERPQLAVRLYRQAAALAPERPEPYVMAQRLLDPQTSPKDALWAAEGVLRNGWVEDWRELHERARTAAETALQHLPDDGSDLRSSWRARIAEAGRRDVVIELTWSGTGDLDLSVEEPPGTVCSFHQRETIAGGLLLHDGYGPVPENCFERYVCPLAVTGDYRINVKQVWGKIVGLRATLRVIRHQNSNRQAVEQHVLDLSEGEASLSIALENGRRTEPRRISTLTARAERNIPPAPQRGGVRRVRRINHRAANAQQAAEAVADFEQSRGRTQAAAQIGGGGLAAGRQQPFQTGLAPGVALIPIGETVQGTATVSPDRRYVRLNIAPVFTELSDVFTFSFISGLNQNPAQR